MIFLVSFLFGLAFVLSILSVVNGLSRAMPRIVEIVDARHGADTAARIIHLGAVRRVTPYAVVVPFPARDRASADAGIRLAA